MGRRNDKTAPAVEDTNTEEAQEAPPTTAEPPKALTLEDLKDLIASFDTKFDAILKTLTDHKTQQTELTAKLESNKAELDERQSKLEAEQQELRNAPASRSEPPADPTKSSPTSTTSSTTDTEPDLTASTTTTVEPPPMEPPPPETQLVVAESAQAQAFHQFLEAAKAISMASTTMQDTKPLDEKRESVMLNVSRDKAITETLQTLVYDPGKSVQNQLEALMRRSSHGNYYLELKRGPLYACYQEGGTERITRSYINISRKLRENALTNLQHPDCPDQGQIRSNIHAAGTILCDFELLHLTRAGRAEYDAWLAALDVAPTSNRTVNISPTNASVYMDAANFSAGCQQWSGLLTAWASRQENHANLPYAAKIERLNASSLTPELKLWGIWHWLTQDQRFNPMSILRIVSQLLRDSKFDPTKDDLFHFAEFFEHYRLELTEFIKIHDLKVEPSVQHILSDAFLLTKLEDAVRLVANWAHRQWNNTAQMPGFTAFLVDLHHYREALTGQTMLHLQSQLNNPQLLNEQYKLQAKMTFTDGSQLIRDLRVVQTRFSPASTPPQKSRPAHFKLISHREWTVALLTTTLLGRKHVAFSTTIDEVEPLEPDDEPSPPGGDEEDEEDDGSYWTENTIDLDDDFDDADDQWQDELYFTRPFGRGRGRGRDGRGRSFGRGGRAFAGRGRGRGRHRYRSTSSTSFGDDRIVPGLAPPHPHHAAKWRDKLKHPALRPPAPAAPPPNKDPNSKKRVDFRARQPFRRTTNFDTTSQYPRPYLRIPTLVNQALTKLFDVANAAPLPGQTDASLRLFKKRAFDRYEQQLIKALTLLGKPQPEISRQHSIFVNLCEQYDPELYATVHDFDLMAPSAPAEDPEADDEEKQDLYHHPGFDIDADQVAECRMLALMGPPSPPPDF